MVSGHRGSCIGVGMLDRSRVAFGCLSHRAWTRTCACFLILSSARTLETLSSIFPYILEASAAEGPLERKVTQLQLHVLPVSDTLAPSTPVEICGLEFTVLPVYHGGQYVSLGFSFGRNCRVVYLSDVDRVPEGTMSFLQGFPIDVLVLDCLHGPGRTHFSHLCYDQSVDLVFRLQPSRAYFVGMFCDVGAHDTVNETLRVVVQARRATDPSCRVTSVELAFDGQVLELDL
eukprot:RCo027178